MGRKLLLAWIPMVSLLAGCPSFSTMGTARNLPEDQTQFFFSTGGVQLRDWRTTNGGARLESLTLPAFEFGGRYGVNDSVEVGGKVWFIGAEIDTKFQIHKAATPDSGMDVALAPAVTVYPFSTDNAAGQSSTAILSWIHLPLLVGVNVPGGSQLVLGPRLSGTLVTGVGETRTVLWGGGSLGYAWKLGKRFRLLPEVSMSYPFAVSSGASVSTDLAFKGVVVQGGLGFLFGG